MRLAQEPQQQQQQQERQQEPPPPPPAEHTPDDSAQDQEHMIRRRNPGGMTFLEKALTDPDSELRLLILPVPAVLPAGAAAAAEGPQLLLNPSEAVTAAVEAVLWRDGNSSAETVTLNEPRFQSGSDVRRHASTAVCRLALADHLQAKLAGAGQPVAEVVARLLPLLDRLVGEYTRQFEHLGQHLRRFEHLVRIEPDEARTCVRAAQARLLEAAFSAEVVGYMLQVKIQWPCSCAAFVCGEAPLRSIISWLLVWGGPAQHNMLIARLHWQSGQHSEVLQYCQRAGSYADVAAHLTRQLALSQQHPERRSALHGSDGLQLQVRRCLSHVHTSTYML